MGELRHGRAENDPVEPAEVDEGAQHDGELVAGVTGVGADPELLREALVLEQAEDGLGVPYVDREEQGQPR